MGKQEENGANIKPLGDFSKLRLFNLFDNLSRHELDRIGRNTSVLEFEKDEIVCVEETRSDSMYFIHSGEVSISQKGVAFAHLETGDYFGEMSLITRRMRNATVTTLVPSVLFEISAAVFDRLFETSPTVMHNLLLTYDARLRRHNDVVVGQFRKLKHQFDELEDSHNRLLLSDKMASIGLLTAEIAHEINNPLFVITGYLDVLNETIQQEEISKEELAEVAEKLDSASQSIVKLVSGIKTYARIVETNPAPIDLNAAIQGSLNLVSFLYKQENIELHNELSGGSPMILGNIGKLQQVLMNLFSNAKDAMESSDTKVISVVTREQDGAAVIEVSDTGCGIGEDDIGRLFTRAFTTKPVGKGSGMGLNLVRKIIQDMGGSISVNSTVSRGTTFKIVFPPFEQGM
ncbi:MAG: cyclic nucleotide-binding domain-containing protein [Xanthomonadales bacterium]|nr:cyclic nucleotide-binding domain-containing protein [Gammaproteobacteria bacterium]MBT8054050.1 cyclic nucleotide-binding domain-containing protein [Gammaproteobacteria bacterium]NND57419.1 cyclic nucleotide-binding domain-containing protein [Xanthomonadales bacterium]NNK50348.1 cyclic nucleotide-binding domain-containing protein [Xanthomonadales bacterium]